MGSLSDGTGYETISLDRDGAAFLEKRDAAFPLRVSQDLPPFFARWQVRA